MCIDGFIPDFTVYKPTFNIVIAYEIGEYLAATIPGYTSVSNSTPKFEVDKKIDDAERDIINCLRKVTIQYSGKHRTVMNDVHKSIPSI